MATDFPSLANHLLVALPALQDPHFERSVILLCHHDAQGAMGLVVNRPTDLPLDNLLGQLQIALPQGESPQARMQQPVLAGGPVHPERGFVLHDGPAQWDSSLRVADDLALTTSRDVLEAIAAGTGPSRYLLALGHASWGAGQLDHELREDAWLTAPVSGTVLFDLPLSGRWHAAVGSIGVNPLHLADHIGHA